MDDEKPPERPTVEGQPEWVSMLLAFAALTMICGTVIVVVWIVFGGHGTP